MFRKKRAIDIKERQMSVICENCTASGTTHNVNVKVDDILLRPTGYKGNFQAYIKCDSCKKEIVLSDELISKELFNFLYKKWNG